MADVDDTIIHELAHAIAGGANGHNNIWKTIAISIGGTGNRYCDKVFAPPRYRLHCPLGCIHYRHQLVRKTYTHRKKGLAPCPKHVDHPIVLVDNSTNKIVRSFADDSDFAVLCIYFNELPT